MIPVTRRPAISAGAAVVALSLAQLAAAQVIQVSDYFPNADMSDRGRDVLLGAQTVMLLGSGRGAGPFG